MSWYSVQHTKNNKHQEKEEGKALKIVKYK